MYEELAAKSGFLFEKEPGGLTVSGRLEPGVYRIPGNISSQFISGLLFALPFLKEDSRIELIPPVESRPYIDMTESALLSFGIRLIRRDENVIEVPGKQRAEGAELIVEGDCSNAAFLEVLNVFGGSVDVKGLNPETLQGDKVYPEYFRKLSEGFSELSLADCPDLGPVLFAASAALHGGRFTETERLRLKESDRVSCMAEELRKFGIRCENDRNTFTVFPGTLQTPEQKLSGHNDHRIVMALSSLLTLTGGEIEGAEAVRKSWPDYFKQLQKLGIEVEKDAVDQ